MHCPAFQSDCSQPYAAKRPGILLYRLVQEYERRLGRLEFDLEDKPAG
jgi:hypothetical protein